MRGFSTYDIAMAKMKLNGLRLNVASMWLNGVQAWPIYKYVITSASVVYSSGDKITAKGDNYATVIGTVEKRKGEIVEETLTDIELVPVFTSADFYLVDNQIHAYDLEKTIKPLTTMSFTVKYVDEHEKESEEFGPMYVTQQENERLVHDLTACDIAVQAAGITCLQNTFSILPTLQADWHDEYTSTYQEDYRDDEAEMTIYINGVAQAAKAKHNVVYYYQVDRDNKHHTDARSWSCYGAYDVRTTQTITLNQGADSKYYIWESQGHLIRIDKTDSGISAAGGDDYYNVSAYAQRTGYRYWQSDDTPTGDTPTVDQTPESWSYGQSSGTGRTFERFSASVTQQGQLKIHHDSMGTFETVDTARYDVWNTSDENVRAYTDDYSIYNRKELDVPAHDSQYGFDIDYVGQSWIDKYGGSVYVACYEKYYHYTDHYTYSSGSEAGGARSDLSRSVNPSVITCNRTEATVYVGEKRIVIPANTHNLSEKYFVVSSSYGGYSDSVTFTQLPDTVVPDGGPRTTCSINVTEEENRLTPGGTTTKTWKVNALRIVSQRYVWATDGAFYDEVSTPYDESWSYRPEIEGVRYSPSKSQDGRFLIITHYDMEWHVTTDICQYLVFIESDETKYVSGLRCEVENSITKRTPEYTTGFTLGTFQQVTSSGNTISIDGQRSYVTEYIKYASGYETGGSSEVAGTTAQSVEILTKSPSGDWCRASGGSIIIDQNIYYTSTRTVSFRAEYDGFRSNGSISQWRCDYSTIVYQCTAFYIASSSVPASVYGRVNGVSVIFTAQQKETVYHDGVPTTGSWVTSQSQHKIELSNSDFELYDSDRGVSGDSIFVYSGDSIVVYPTSANTLLSERSTTITESLGHNSRTFLQKGVERQTITITCGYSESSSGKVIPYVRASASVHSNISVSFEIVHGNSRFPLTYVGNLTIINGSTLSTGSETQITAANVIRCSVTSISPTSDTQADYVF